MVGLDPRDPDSATVANEPDKFEGLRLAYSPRLGLDVAVDDVVADGLALAVERLSDAGLQIAHRDPVWPPGATEESIMPLQQAGLAALHGGLAHGLAAFDQRMRAGRGGVGPTDEPPGERAGIAVEALLEKVDSAMVVEKFGPALDAEAMGKTLGPKVSGSTKPSRKSWLSSPFSLSKAIRSGAAGATSSLTRGFPPLPK